MTGSSIAPRNHLSWIARLVPAIGWLRTYQRGWFRADVIAGVTLAAYLIPASIGDASLANLPPSSGLYACIFSGLVFWLFTSSMRTSVTITSAIALLVGSSLGTIAGGDTERYATLAAGTAVMVAALALLARLVRAGGIVNFISETVLIGFKTGVALYLASTQLPKLCGLRVLTVPSGKDPCISSAMRTRLIRQPWWWVLLLWAFCCLVKNSYPINQWGYWWFSAVSR